MQNYGAVIVLLGSWFVGIPLGFTFGLVKDASESLGMSQNPTLEGDEDAHGGSLFGLWSGIFVGYVVICSLFARTFIKIDWNSLCLKNASKDNTSSENNDEVEMSLVAA